MDIKPYLTQAAKDHAIDPAPLQLPSCTIDSAKIKTIMISEVPPQDPAEGFYSNAPQPDYMRSTLGLFEKAGVRVKSMCDILDLGIYITTAVKAPKTEYTVPTATIKAQLPILQAEIALFKNLKAIMLMGDVAKKAVNMITKAEMKRNVIPPESTYKVRGNEYYWNSVRVFPSYIITGGNILIEKSKCEMVVDDIRRMMALIS